MRKLALISVFDKEGLASLANTLKEMGYELLATGGTRKHLESEGFEVIEVSDLTGEQERFGGRVKTLHHKILGGILFRPGKDESEWPYDFRIGAVVCNFYPFEEKSKECETLEELMEWVDIGGPTMVRAAAKNHEHVWVVTNPKQYSRFIMGQALHQEGLARRLALQAFENVRHLDELIADEFHQRYLKGTDRELRYGENPHQKARFVPSPGANLRVLGQLSFNNHRDAEAAYRFVAGFDGPACSVIKHQTLCGAAAGVDGSNTWNVFEEAWEGDTVSRFGSVIGMNFEPGPEITEVLKKHFVEVIVLPRTAAAEEWAEVITKEKERLRVVLVESKFFGKDRPEYSESFGGRIGTLYQGADRVIHSEDTATLSGLFKYFGQWTAACSKSNAMSLVGFDESKNILYLAGVGQGQPNRVEALEKLAIPRARDFCKRRDISFEKLSCFSDAFIPFPDSIQILHREGLKRLFQPGGSKKDSEVKKVAEQLGVEMILTRERHFWH